MPVSARKENSIPVMESQVVATLHHASGYQKQEADGGNASRRRARCGQWGGGMARQGAAAPVERA